MVLVTGGVNLDRVLSSTELYVTALQRAAPDVASGD
jgi:hypothetical protein